MLWVFWALVSVILRSVYHMLSKHMMAQRIPSSFLIVMFTCPTNLLYSMAIYLVLRPVIELTLVSLTAVFTGAMVITYFLAFLKAIQIEEASRVVPLVHSYPVLVAILAALFLGEVFSPLVYGGILLVMLGSILLSFRFEKGLIRKIPALELTLLAVSVMAVQVVMARWIFNYYDLWTYFFYNAFGWFLGSLTLWRRRDFRLSFKETFVREKRNTLLFLSLESLGVTSVLCNFYAILLGTATLASAISSITPLFVLIFATVISFKWPQILKEELGKVVWLKLLAVLLIILGVYLIT